MEFKRVFYIRNGSFEGLYRKDGDKYKIWKKLNNEKYGYANILDSNHFNEMYEIPKIFSLWRDLDRILNIIRGSNPYNTQKFLIYLADNKYPLCIANYEMIEAKNLWRKDYK